MTPITRISNVPSTLTSGLFIIIYCGMIAPAYHPKTMRLVKHTDGVIDFGTRLVARLVKLRLEDHIGSSEAVYLRLMHRYETLSVSTKDLAQ